MRNLFTATAPIIAAAMVSSVLAAGHAIAAPSSLPADLNVQASPTHPLKPIAEDNHENIVRKLEFPEALPDRDVADLEAGSLCLDGGVQCIAISWQDPKVFAIWVQDRSFEKTSPDAFKNIPLKSNFDENATIRLWDMYLVREDQQYSERPHYIIGVVTTVNEAYSGGGASSSVLYLYDLQGVGTNYPTAREILSVPFDGEKNIRACFSEKDQQDRKGVCQDRYSYTGRITVAANTQEAWPVLNYSAEANAYPRGVNLDTDNTGRILTRADLVSETDTDCTFTRMAHYNPLTARYEFSEAGPDCREYLVRYGE